MAAVPAILAGTTSASIFLPSKAASLTLSSDNAKHLLEFIQSGGAITPAAAIVNDLGYGAELHKAKRIQEAIADPSKYIKDRTDLLEEYAQEAVVDYQSEMSKLFAIGVTKDVAEKIAHDHTKAKSTLKLTYLNADYPSGILAEALKSQSTILAAAGANFA